MHREYAMGTAQAQVNVLCKKPGAVTEEGRTGAKQTSARLYLITGILRRTEPYLSRDRRPAPGGLGAGLFATNKEQYPNQRPLMANQKDASKP
jgi:hypothetical protein